MSVSLATTMSASRRESAEPRGVTALCESGHLGDRVGAGLVLVERYADKCLGAQHRSGAVDDGDVHLVAARDAGELVDEPEQFGVAPEADCDVEIAGFVIGIARRRPEDPEQTDAELAADGVELPGVGGRDESADTLTDPGTVVHEYRCYRRCSAACGVACGVDLRMPTSASARCGTTVVSRVMAGPAARVRAAVIRCVEKAGRS